MKDPRLSVDHLYAFLFFGISNSKILEDTFYTIVPLHRPSMVQNVRTFLEKVRTMVQNVGTMVQNVGSMHQNGGTFLEKVRTMYQNG